MDGHSDAARHPNEPPTEDQPGAVRLPPERPGHLPGEETLDHAMAVPPPPSARSAASRWLARWLLFSGTGAGALAVGSLVLAVAAGTRPVDWRSALLAFDCAVIILILRRSVVAGSPASSACRWAFGVAGLTAAVLAVQASLLRAAIRFVYGAPAHSVLTGFFVFGLLGLGGCIVFVQALRGVGWAARTAAVASVIFLLLLLLEPAHGRPLVPRRLQVVRDSSAAYQAGLVAVVLCAAGFALSWERLVRGGHSLRRRLSTGLVWLVLAGAAVAFVAWRVNQQAPPGGAFRDLWQNAALWECVALLPALLAGMVIAWRQRKSLPDDCLEAVRLLWVLALLGGVACLAVWVPARLTDGGLELVLVSTGVLVGMLGAWMGLTRGDWFSRWTSLPAAALVVGALGSVPALVAMAQPRGALWVGLTVFLWCSIVTGLLFATAGLLLRRHRGRRSRPTTTAQTDADSLARAGLMLAVVAGWLALVPSAGAPPLTAALQGALRTGAACLGDAVALAAGNQAGDWLRGLSVSGPPPALLAGSLAVLLVVHALAAARVRAALWAMIALWCVPLMVVSLLVVLSLSGLFFPRPQPMATGLARLVVGSFSIRLLATMLSCAVVARLWEALLGAAAVARGARPATAQVHQSEGRAPSGPDDHLVFLVRTGVIVGAAGLGLAAVLCGQPLVRAALGELAALARAAGTRLFGLAAQVGELSVQWTGNALAAAVVLYLVAALSVEVRRGRVAAYPLVAGLWTLLSTYALSRCLVDVFAFWGRPWARTLVTALVMVPLAAIFAAAGALWVRWWRLSREGPRDPDRIEEPPPRGGPAFALGSLGIALCVVAAAAVLHGALLTTPSYAAEAARVAQAVRNLAAQAAGAVARRAAYHGPKAVVATSAVVGISSIAVLVVHLFARGESFYWRAALFGLWGGVVLLGLSLGYGLVRTRTDAWGPGELVWALLGGYVLVRALVALANVPRWPAHPPDGTVCE